jgi:hypothetical protein
LDELTREHPAKGLPPKKDDTKTMRLFQAAVRFHADGQGTGLQSSATPGSQSAGQDTSAQICLLTSLSKQNETDQQLAGKGFGWKPQCTKPTTCICHRDRDSEVSVMYHHRQMCLEADVL